MDKKKAFKIALALHAGALVLMSVTAPPLSEEDPQAIQKPLSGQPIKAASITSEELSITLDSFYTDRDAAQQKEAAVEKRLADAKAQYKRQQNEITAAKKKLEKVNKDYEAAKKIAEELKKKSSPPPPKIVQETKKVVKKTEAQKRAQIAKLKEEKLKQEKLRKAKIENAKLLKKIKADNDRKEKERLAIVRGEYEKNIHDNLFGNWITPYHRENVVCKVELMLNETGLILGHRFVTGCPDTYKVSIENAIADTGFMPKVPKEVFKPLEEVNFIDNGTSSPTVSR
ncbi:TonB C-terminal domain-containing protein [Vibrio crassostreae]|uniref:TonB C-terminal domain-containing protein n=1 Tax=Vibrio crassostreae TaxID=246167 RepID=UPI001B30DD79|nr:TonB C-terminal domain-containing protein [Vibrio crassostreae]